MGETRATKLFSEYVAARERGLDPDLDALCREHPDCAAELRELLHVWRQAESILGLKSDANQATAAPGENGRLRLSPPSAEETEPLPTSLLARLTRRGPPKQRFVVKERIGQGGMGAVYRVYDNELGRHVAAKVIRSGDPAYLPRFLEEAQVTGQLDHPAFIPVHDIGVDEDGKVYFTMKLVKGIAEEGKPDVRGETLLDVIERIHSPEKGEWTLTRGISDVIVRVAEAMAFAHAKGVIHRDLKPANILVGRYGEVYVTDFGIARVQGKERAAVQASSIPLTLVRTERRDSIERNAATPPLSDSPISPGPTEEGATIGTAEYMPPEQAEGRLAEIGPRSDIYSLGATLYHLIAGVPPWHTRDEHPNGRVIIDRIRAGLRPSPLRRLVPKLSAPLIAIVNKAMSASPARRYDSMQAFALDLHSFLGRRVVSAYESGVLAELKSWILRNIYSSSIFTFFTLISTCFVLISLYKTDELNNYNKNLEKTIEEKDKEIDQRDMEIGLRELENGSLMEEKQAVDSRLREYDQLEIQLLLERARKHESKLYPAWPERIAEMEGWLEDYARPILERSTKLNDTVSQLRKRAIPESATQGYHQASRQPTFRTTTDEFLFRSFEKLITDTRMFESKNVESVKRRLNWARNLERLTLNHPRSRVTWADARLAISNADGETASRLYLTASEKRIALEPQMGLVPIGMNPVTKLWEFYDLRSACDIMGGQDPESLEIPRHSPDGNIDVKDETGVIFVLLPGGKYLQGAQSQDPEDTNFDPDADSDESPQMVTLTPFLLAKHELTRGQWSRLVNLDTKPTSLTVPDSSEKIEVSLTHPMIVSWNLAKSALLSCGMELPTEARWEYGARAGTTTRWWTGQDISSLQGAANILDPTATEIFPKWGPCDCSFFDGFMLTAPVGSYRPNPFGLYDIHGNMWEWCADTYSRTYGEPRDGDGLRTDVDELFPQHRVIRGGSYYNPSSFARSSMRNCQLPPVRYLNIGVRPARTIK